MTGIPEGTLNRLLDQHAAREAHETIQSLTGARPGPHATKRGDEGLVLDALQLAAGDEITIDGERFTIIRRLADDRYEIERAR